jgi:hypothetical protein
VLNTGKSGFGKECKFIFPTEQTNSGIGKKMLTDYKSVNALFIRGKCLGTLFSPPRPEEISSFPDGNILFTVMF